MTDRHVFFWAEWPSNFTATRFVWSKFGESREFFCTEQAFMWAKAKFFADETTAAEILAETADPLKCKRLGRKVENYNDRRWDAVRYGFFLEVNIEKYRQDPVLRGKLLSPEFDGKAFAEASPFDRIWGIGLGLDTPLEILDDERNWKGRNLLGKVLTECRAEIQKTPGH